MLVMTDPAKLVWNFDALFVIHPDTKSHSGMTMTMGKGAITSLSRKQKLNTRSSTEAELVAVAGPLDQILFGSPSKAIQPKRT